MRGPAKRAHSLSELITRTRSSESSFTHFHKPTVRHLNLNSIVKMRELLIKRGNNAMEIPHNTSVKNDFLKTLLEPGRISLEVSPNSDFDTAIFSEIKPRFVAVTWLGKTHLEHPTEEIPAIVLAKKLCEKDYPVLLHLAGRNIDKERMLEILKHVQSIGVKNILALQGDWPHVLEHDDSKCDFPYASDLVLFIKENFGDAFCIGVAGYPNVHPHCKNREENMYYLKKKVSNGADFIVTQATFTYTALEEFATLCREYDITIPILAGIFIIKSFKSLLNIAKCCEFKISEIVFNFVMENRKDKALVEEYGLEVAADLVKNCLEDKNLFFGAHFFTMNDMAEVQKVLAMVQSLGVSY